VRDVTDLMNNYRECSRNLWNIYFGPDAYALDSVYEQIRRLLFDGLVTKQLEGETEPTSSLIVAPMESLPILIGRLSSDGNCYWDQEPELRAKNGDGIQLEFVDYYDFFQQPVKDFRFYRCKVLKFPLRPEYEGREALVDVANARVFHGKSRA
jgi:hypothetical protein